MVNIPILSILTFLPLVGLPFIILGRLINTENYQNIAKYVAFFVSFITFVISIVLLVNFKADISEFQFIENKNFMNGVFTYSMGIDGISILFILLSTFLTPICILASWNIINDRVDYYMCAFLVLETLMIGTFCALDIVLFYLFFESVLIPMFIIIGVWGGQQSLYFLEM